MDKCLSSLGHDLRPDQVYAIFRFIDHDGDGKIDFDEFCSIWKRRARTRPRFALRARARACLSRQKHHERWLEKITEQFDEIIERRKKYDVASLPTACINTSKLRDILEGNIDAEHTREQVDRLIALADVDGDGSVDFNEFKAMIVTNAQIRDIFPFQV